MFTASTAGNACRTSGADMIMFCFRDFVLRPDVSDDPWMLVFRPTTRTQES